MDSSEGAEPSEKKFVFPPAPRSIKKRGRLLRPRPLAADNCQLGGRFFPHFFVFAFPMPPPCPFLFKETINGFELSAGPTTMVRCQVLFGRGISDNPNKGGDEKKRLASAAGLKHQKGGRSMIESKFG